MVARKYQRGPTRLLTWPGGAALPPWAHGPAWLCGALVACLPMSFGYKITICPRKNHRKSFGTIRRRLKVEPGQEHFCSPAERFRRGYFPPQGINQSHRHHQRSSHHGRLHLHQHLHQHHLISEP